MGRILIGVDFGSGEARVSAVDIKTGQMIGIATCPYQSGVMDKILPNAKLLPPNFALNDPSDWMNAMSCATKKLVMDTGIPQSEIISLGISFTSCCCLPVDDGGMPLCLKPAFAENPHAWPKHWKHAASLPQAKRLTEIATDRGEPFLEYCGGRIGPEWLWPKLLETIEQSPELIPHIAYYLELGDWIAWQLTGTQTRNQCSAGYKACWVEGDGYPSNDFFAHASVDLARIVENQRDIPIVQSGKLAGRLLPEFAEQLSLPAGLPVAVPVIDAQVGVLGSGVYSPETMVMVMGSSTIHLVMSKLERMFVGFAGMVKDGILDGYWGYEAGQPATGDLLDWFRNTLAPIQLFERAREDDVDEMVVMDRWLHEEPTGSGGIVALDWWNGNRSVLLNPTLKGMISGFTLGTTAPQILKGLVEATGFGTRKIIDTFKANEIAIDKIVATGSIPYHYPGLLQIYSDICNIPITVPDVQFAVARGAAILGGFAVGVENLGFATRKKYFEAMKPQNYDSFTPNPENVAKYDIIFKTWSKFHDWFA